MPQEFFVNDNMCRGGKSTEPSNSLIGYLKKINRKKITFVEVFNAGVVD